MNTNCPACKVIPRNVYESRRPLELERQRCFKVVICVNCGCVYVIFIAHVIDDLEDELETFTEKELTELGLVRVGPRTYAFGGPYGRDERLTQLVSVTVDE